MNATELFLSDGRKAGIFYCGQCRNVRPSKEAAEQCCRNYLCSSCGKDTGSRSWLVCDGCHRQKRIEQEQSRFAAAEKLLSWDGWIYDGSDFFESLEWFIETKEEHDLRQYVWACKANHFVRATIGDITQAMGDGAYEDWEPDTLSGLPELKAALDKFNEANKNVCSYEPDYTKAVLLEKPTPSDEAGAKRLAA